MEAVMPEADSLPSRLFWLSFATLIPLAMAGLGLALADAMLSEAPQHGVLAAVAAFCGLGSAVAMGAFVRLARSARRPLRAC
jgi:hypothetical protein